MKGNFQRKFTRKLFRHKWCNADLNLRLRIEKSQIPNLKSQITIAEAANKLLWLDIEMRCAVCAAAKVENYF